MNLSKKGRSCQNFVLNSRNSSTSYRLFNLLINLFDKDSYRIIMVSSIQ